MFADYMVNAWLAATLVAVVAPAVGFFVVMRGEAFATHAIPEAAFSGAAGATVIGVNPLLGMGVVAAVTSVLTGTLGRRGRHDVVTALVMTLMVALGSLWLTWTSTYTSKVYSLLFGEILGVSDNAVGVMAGVGLLVLALVAILWRPFLLSSALPDVAAARGVRVGWVNVAFLVIVALASTAAVPVVGALLVFSLMVGPAAIATVLCRSPLWTLLTSVALGLACAWGAIVLAYQTNWPVGFFVTSTVFVAYAVVRAARSAALISFH